MCFACVSESLSSSVITLPHVKYFANESLSQKTVTYLTFFACALPNTVMILVEAKAVPLHATEALGWRKDIAPTHSRHRH
jgi:hypothetical protein